jgi:aryl-alcohol dehydrogenase-like predicted oxidoreductase/RimJ/RimL family protein N-acetyltransferase
MKIITKNLTLKKFSLKFVTKNYLSWFNNSEIKKYITNRPKNIKTAKSYLQKFIKNPNIYFWAIYKKKKHIGNIKIEQISKKKNSATLGILIGDQNSVNKGLGFEVIEAVKKFLLKKNIQFLYLGVNKNNTRAIKAYSKCGFYAEKINKDIITMKCNLLTSKLILGGAQLNSNYGITNFKNYNQTIRETKKIINLIKKKNIYHIDGAEIYKLFNSKNIKILRGMKVNTKISIKNIFNYEKLKIKMQKYLKNKIIIDTLFIHDADDVFKANNIKKFNILYRLKKNKIIKNIGLSNYDFKILKKIIPKYKIDVIQVPYNIVDRRLEKLKSLCLKHKTKIYVRSVFLQGALLKKVNYIELLSSIYQKVLQNSKKTKQTNYDNCLNFVYHNDLVDKIIVGVRNVNELNKLINFKLAINSNKINFNKNEKLFAYNPSKWK